MLHVGRHVPDTAVAADTPARLPIAAAFGAFYTLQGPFNGQPPFRPYRVPLHAGE